MTDWLPALIPYFKALHIVALFFWCGGLFALPLMLSRHDPTGTPDDYTLIRRATHLTYTMIATPAAIVAVVAGTWLIFLREALVPWFYAKLLFVAVLVAFHAWVGHVIVSVAESKNRKGPPSPYIPIMIAILPMLAILTLVLGKPDLSWIELPGFLTEPRGRQLPFDVPSP